MSGTGEIGSPYVMVTNDGPHPPVKWAVVIADDIVRIDGAEADALRARIVTVMAPLFTRIATNHAAPVTVMVDEALVGLRRAFTESAWPYHLDARQAEVDMCALLYRFLGEARLVADQWRGHS